MGELIGILVVIYLVYLLIRYVLVPISGAVLTITLVLGIGCAFYISIRSFITSLIKHQDPYSMYVDKSPDAPHGIKRNYFFGPGYHQISAIVSDAFSLQKINLATLKGWKDRHIGFPWYRDMWIWIFYSAAIFCTFVFGFAWMAVFSILLSIVIVTGMCGFYVFFMSLWGFDRLLLMIKAIQSRCPKCKRISIVPSFICPDCGMEHKKLTPGPYGVFKRKCSCEKKMSTTYFNGRSKYRAVCPFCASGLAASDAQQFGIQLVGGVSTGKTTFLTAFWHEYLEYIEPLKKTRNISLTTIPKAAFADLEYWFQHGDSSATTETNANMYSLIHRVGNKTPIQMTLYDIAGEAFTSLANDIQQRQFNYCEGIVFVIDHTSTPGRTSETVSSFINEFIGLKGSHSTKISDVPVAVIITKADLCTHEIGLTKIISIYNENVQKNAVAESNASMELVRNGLCKDFLKDRGFANVMNIIAAKFNNVQYYSVSAIGHPVAQGRKYEPWGVLEPIIWLMRQHGTVFQDILTSFIEGDSQWKTLAL
ncbi:MAG: hypothetical protein LBQ94_04495 [Treponema sp.]|jgi:GTPase SAR1 family protein|nr:hypothetical protein [Treponema sp.]